MKIVIISLTVCIAIVVMAVFHFRAVSNYRSLGQVRVLVSDINTNMLTLRRNEKDFLARNNLQYRQKFIDNYKGIQLSLQALGSRLQGNDIETIQLDRLAGNFDSYKNSFLALVALQQEIGLDHQNGLHGSMRDAIHQVEDLLTARQHIQLSRDMLMLRRREKDFILRNDNEYIEKFDQDMLVMQSDLLRVRFHPEIRKQLVTALATYEEDFKALASLTQKKGFSSDEGLRGEMHRSVHQTEGILEELREKSLQLIGSAGSYVIIQMAVFAALLMLFMIALILFLPGTGNRKN